MQSPVTGPKQPNIIEDIKKDHAHFRHLYSQIKDCGTTSSTDEQKQTLVWQLIHDLTVHSLAEEEVLYPEMKNKMGTKCRDHALAEHKTLKNLLSDLDAMTVKSPGFNDKIEVMMYALDHHVREEEDEMMPEFASLVDRGMLAALAEQFQASKRRVPTRPHPMAPDKPITGNIIGNTLTAPIDKLRDAVRASMEPAAAHAEAPAGQS